MVNNGPPASYPKASTLALFTTSRRPTSSSNTSRIPPQQQQPPQQRSFSPAASPAGFSASASPIAGPSSGRMPGSRPGSASERGSAQPSGFNQGRLPPGPTGPQSAGGPRRDSGSVNGPPAVASAASGRPSSQPPHKLPHHQPPPRRPAAPSNAIAQKLTELPDRLFSIFDTWTAEKASTVQLASAGLAPDETDELYDLLREPQQAARLDRMSAMEEQKRTLATLAVDLLQEAAGQKLHEMLEAGLIAPLAASKPQPHRVSEIDALRSEVNKLKEERDSAEARFKALEAAVATLQQKQTDMRASSVPPPAAIPPAVAKADLDAVISRLDQVTATLNGIPASTVLGKRSFSADAEDPNAPVPKSPPPLSGPSIGLSARLDALEGKVSEVLEAKKAHEKEVKELRKQDQIAKDAEKAVRAKDLADREEEKKLQREEQERESREKVERLAVEVKRAEQLEGLEKRVSELPMEIQIEIKAALESQFKALTNDIAAVKANPALHTRPVSPVTLAQLRTDLEALDVSLSARISSLRLPTATHSALLDTLEDHLRSKAPPTDASAESVPSLRRALDSWTWAAGSISTLSDTVVQLEGIRADRQLLALGARCDELRTEFMAKFGALKGFVAYLETSALPEFQSVSSAIRKLQAMKRIPSNKELGLEDFSDDNGASSGSRTDQLMLNVSPAANGANGVTPSYAHTNGRYAGPSRQSAG
ncbi:hypothetical protein JCM11641_006582 [Rhodosporidiobolus odoratus]